MEVFTPPGLFVLATFLAALGGFWRRIQSLVGVRWPTFRESCASLLGSGIFGFCISLGGCFLLGDETTGSPGILASYLIVMAAGVSGLGGDLAIERGWEMFWRALEAIVQQRSKKP